MQDTRICTCCAERKQYTEFKKETRSPTGVASICKACHTAKQRKRYKENPPEYDSKARRIKTLAVYGLTLEEYDEMWEDQNGECAICGVKEKHAPKGRFHVDHDHDTGVVRALLCGHCNKGLGMFRDNSEFLANAADYLKGFGK